MTFPRLAALAEIGWSPKEGRGWTDFLARMDAHARRLERLGVTAYVEPPRLSSGSLEFEDKTTASFVVWRSDAVMRYTTDGTDPTAASPVLPGAITIDRDTTVNLVTMLPNGRLSDPVTYVFEKIATK